ncbi:hypothetical protein [Acidithiobacillus ferrivorans]|uniref:Uncharacterized protein n=1 Tax=Acidithiobacillus ferrivorans TaxID=160808 RepID=A0A7T4WC52_9PROT|nr:hypothetical protein [Acidithiobacillus ferrivorans]QQD71908.1 hypothetical protein H2515_10775 [Acidithiobacillus ferrivorans]
MSSHQIIKKGPVIGQYENRPIRFAPAGCETSAGGTFSAAEKQALAQPAYLEA